MGGSKNYIIKVAEKYEEILEKSLSHGKFNQNTHTHTHRERERESNCFIFLCFFGEIAISNQSGCLGTEETVITMTWYSNPHLFHIFYNTHKRTDFCYFIWEPSYEKLPLQKWAREQEQKEKEHWETHKQQQ